MRDFTKLDVWIRAHLWALELHRISRSLHGQKEYELGRQLRRAAFSVPTNIAEGSGHESRAEYGRYLNIAAASTPEVEYLMIACRDLGYVNASVFKTIDSETRSIRRMLVRLSRSIRAPS